MAHYNSEWDELGKSIQDIIDRAVGTQDYQKLNQTVHQVVDRVIDVGGEAVRKVVTKSTGPSFRGASRAAAAPKPVIHEQPQNLPALYGSIGGKSAGAVAKIVGGSLLSAAAVVTLAASAALEALVSSAVSVSFPVGVGILLLAFGIGLFTGGIRGLNRLSRFRIYKKTLGSKTYCKLETLAQSVHKSGKFVRKDLAKMIRQGLFRQGHLDQEQTMLITSHETYRYFEQSRLQLEQRQQEAKALEEQRRQKEASRAPQVQEVLDKGDAFLTQIRSCNDAIPGEVISQKISQIELTVQHIFDRAEAHPEVIPDLKKMMDYYLPMTVKLLRAYADMDAQSIQGETILSAKQEIEDTLDTLNVAFENLLDDLFEDTAMDVSSDISVLKTLLAQEGLTEDPLTQMKKQKETN